MSTVRKNEFVKKLREGDETPATPLTEALNNLSSRNVLDRVVNVVNGHET